MDDGVTFGFVCVQNAGRSQMAAAFAREERERRDLESAVEIVTGGTHPASEVHPEVVEAMQDVGIDISGREPRHVSSGELNDCDIVATMGCSTLDLDADVEVRDWALEDPEGKDPEAVRAIREEVKRRVGDLFEEYLQGTVGN